MSTSFSLFLSVAECPTNLPPSGEDQLEEAGSKEASGTRWGYYVKFDGSETLNADKTCPYVLLETCLKTPANLETFNIVHNDNHLHVYYNNLVEVEINLDQQFAFIRFNNQNDNSMLPTKFERIYNNFEYVDSDNNLKIKTRRILDANKDDLVILFNRNLRLRIKPNSFKIKMLKNAYVDQTCGLLTEFDLTFNNFKDYYRPTYRPIELVTQDFDQVCMVNTVPDCRSAEAKNTAESLCAQTFSNCQDDNMFAACVRALCNGQDPSQGFICEYNRNVEESCRSQGYEPNMNFYQDTDGCFPPCMTNEVYTEDPTACQAMSDDCSACEPEGVISRCICQPGFVRDINTFNCVPDSICGATNNAPMPVPSCHIQNVLNSYEGLNLVSPNSDCKLFSTNCDVSNQVYPSFDLYGNYDSNSQLYDWTLDIYVSVDLEVSVKYNTNTDKLQIQRSLQGVISENLMYYSPQTLEFESYVLEINGNGPYELYFAEGTLASSRCEENHLIKLDFNYDLLKIESACSVYEASCSENCDVSDQLAGMDQACYVDPATQTTCYEFMLFNFWQCLFPYDKYLEQCKQMICSSSKPQSAVLCDLGHDISDSCFNENQVYQGWMNSNNNCEMLRPACKGANMEYLECGNNRLESIYNCNSPDDDSAICATNTNCKAPGCYCQEGFIWDNNYCIPADQCNDPDDDPTPDWNQLCEADFSYIEPNTDVLSFDEALMNVEATQCYQTLVRNCQGLTNFEVNYKLAYNSEYYQVEIFYKNVKISLDPSQDIHIRSTDGADLEGMHRGDLSYWYAKQRFSFTGSRALGYTLTFEIDNETVEVFYSYQKLGVKPACNLSGYFCDNTIFGNFNKDEADDNYVNEDSCSQSVAKNIEELSCHSIEVEGLGDPHYGSFDSFALGDTFPNANYVDHMGTCSYIATQLCDATETHELTPWFRVILETGTVSEKNPSVTVIQGTLIQYQPFDSQDLIEMYFNRGQGVKNMVWRLNGGVWRNFEDYAYPEYGIKKMFYDGQDVVYLNVVDDDWFLPENSIHQPKAYSVVIKMRDFVTKTLVACPYKRKICGLFGDFNDVTDDLVKSDGSVVDLSNVDDSSIRFKFKEFGDSWIYPSDSTCAEQVTDPFDFSQCGDLSRFAEYCDFRSYVDMTGFADCQLSDDYYNKLVHLCQADLCGHENDQDVINSISCSYRETYVSACRDAGHQIFDDWRVSVGSGVLPAACPAACGLNEEWIACGSLCTEDFTNCQEDFICQDVVCVPKCQCQAGFIWSGQACVPKERCPVDLKPDPTPELRCFGEAQSYGDVHHISFDESRLDYQGHCQYQLSKVCNSWNMTTETPYFNLKGRQEKKEIQHVDWVTYLHSWEIEWQTIDMPSAIVLKFDRDVNAMRPMIRLSENDYRPDAKVVAPNGVSLGLPKPVISRTSNFIDLEAGYLYDRYQIYTEGLHSETIYFGYQDENNWILKLTWGFDYNLIFNVDCAYRNQLCGFYGNFNGNPKDDWTLPSGELARRPGKVNDKAKPQEPFRKTWEATWEYGNQWLVDTDFCPLDHNYKNNQWQCTPDEELEIESLDFCGQIWTASFSECHVNKQQFYDDCVFDLCAVGAAARAQALCDILSAFESSCENAGQYVDVWRHDNLCPITCSHSTLVYNHNAIGCVRNQQNCNNFVCTKPGRPRCECPNNGIWNGYKCVDFCPPIEPEVELPFDKCIGFATGFGDTHYLSFDGRETDFQGECNYQISKLCKTEYENVDTPYFKVTARQQKKPDSWSQHVTYIHGWNFVFKPHANDSTIINLSYDYDDPTPQVYISIGDNNKYKLGAPYYYEDYNIFVPSSNQETIYFGINSVEESLLPEQNYAIKFTWQEDSHMIGIELDCAYKTLVCGMTRAVKMYKKLYTLHFSYI